MKNAFWACLAIGVAACDDRTASTDSSGGSDTASTTPSSVSEAVTRSGTATPAAELAALSGGDPTLRLSKRQILDLYSEASCDSLEGSTGQVHSEYNRGLRGRVRVPAAGRNPSSFDSLTSFETANAFEQLSNKIYLSQVNVPTRAFSAGFPTLSGDLFKNALGETLLEYFRIDLEGYLELTPDMTPGDYELAVLADDGAELQLGTTLKKHLSYPGVTQTRLMCGTETVHLGLNETLPMRLKYFQGPRYHIALMLLWRPASEVAEPDCGASGNDRWFDSSQTPSTPKNKFLALQDRGWSVVPPQAFRIPDDELVNPCESDHVRDVFESCSNGDCIGIGI